MQKSSIPRWGFGVHISTFVFFPKKAVFTLDLLIFDPLFQTPDAHSHPPKDHLVICDALAPVDLSKSFSKVKVVITVKTRSPNGGKLCTKSWKN